MKLKLKTVPPDRLKKELLNNILIKYKAAKDEGLPSLDVALRRVVASNFKESREDAEILLDYDAKINSQDTTITSLRAAIHWAAIKKQPDLIKLLCERSRS